MVPREFNILLCEDNEDHIFLTKRAISQAKDDVDFKISVARDGSEALEKLKRSKEGKEEPRPDLIILDLAMPRIDGFEVLERLKSDKDLRIIPVVVLTASTNEDDVIKAYSLGGNSYISKPLRFEDFLEKIKQVPLYWTKVATTPATDIQ